jgi:hypothetical protein
MKAAKISTAFAFILGIALIAGCSSVQNLTKQNVLTVKSDDGSSITYGVHGQGGRPSFLCIAGHAIVNSGNLRLSIFQKNIRSCG